MEKILIDIYWKLLLCIRVASLCNATVPSNPNPDITEDIF